MVVMSCPRLTTPGDGRDFRQGTSLLNIAGEKTRASAPWDFESLPKGRFFRTPGPVEPTSC